MENFFEMEIHEVDDVAVLQSIDEIANGSRQNRRQRDGRKDLVILQLNENEDDENERKNRNADKKDLLKRRRSFLQQAEGKAVISGINQGNKTRNHVPYRIKGHRRQDEVFGKLIAGQN